MQVFFQIRESSRQLTDGRRDRRRAGKLERRLSDTGAVSENRKKPNGDFHDGIVASTGRVESAG